MENTNCDKTSQNHRNRSQNASQFGPQVIEFLLKPVELPDEVIEVEAEEIPDTGQAVHPTLAIRPPGTVRQFLKTIQAGLRTKYRAVVRNIPGFLRRSGRLAGQVGKLLWAIVRNIPGFLRRSGRLAGQVGKLLWAIVRFALSVVWAGVLFVHSILKVVVPVVLPWLAGFTVLLTIAYGIVLIGEWLIAQKAFWSGLAIVSGAAYLVWMAAMFLSVRRRRPRMPSTTDTGPMARYDHTDAGPVSRSDRTVINILNHVSVSRSGKTVINIFNQIIKND